MSDLEQRLADALTDGAQGAPSAPGLAAAARSRARTRRRNRLAGATAVVAMAVAVPTVVLAAGGSDDPGSSRIATDPGNTVRGAPAGYRVESWHSVSVDVPETWGYGSLDAWCAGGGSFETPRVSRPGDVSEMIACTPAAGYGISFQEIDNKDDFQWPVVQQPGNESYPPGSYSGGSGIGGVLVMVTAPTRAAGLDVLATMRAIGPEGDANGCPVDAGSDPVVPGDSMTVCRYDASGQLEQSELLTGSDVDAAEGALQNAVADGYTCAGSLEPQGSIRMASVAQDAEIDLACGVLLLHGVGRDLTPEILYWALSPGWSGSAPPGVSLPSELRKR